MFECAKGIGAALITKTPMLREDIVKNDVIPAYIKQHIDSWYEFAQDLHYTLVEGEIIMVRGCDKTAAWALAAFTQRQRKGEIFFRGGFVGF